MYILMYFILGGILVARVRRSMRGCHLANHTCGYCVKLLAQSQRVKVEPRPKPKPAHLESTRKQPFQRLGMVVDGEVEGYGDADHLLQQKESVPGISRIASTWRPHHHCQTRRCNFSKVPSGGRPTCVALLASDEPLSDRDFARKCGDVPPRGKIRPWRQSRDVVVAPLGVSVSLHHRYHPRRREAAKDPPTVFI